MEEQQESCIFNALRDMYFPKVHGYDSQTYVAQSKYLQQQKQHVSAKAEGWFFSDAYYIGSYRYCCEVIGLDPGVLREAIRDKKIDKIMLKHAQVRKGQGGWRKWSGENWF